ncbi:hypothetical protein EW145_g2931 [Phellinidium pouzarii]|uniref:Reverse transcriptase Ty1/copia-type domain-containing protein n=1 Tax=Phellinidium pouzarii TaxID=167371 RepID=A0A4S4LAZ7_9AGAM|nr:hypothetical protein EW145_g2931 [Phellinidium pouzarii]
MSSSLHSKKHVDITDLGPAHWLLGLEIKHNRDAKTIALSQTAYINSILRRFNLQDIKPVSTPMEVNMQLHSSQVPQTAEETAEMRNALLWNTVKHVFRYLNGTKSLWLTYGGVENGFLKGCGDADGSMQEDRHAISGNAFLIDGGAVSWFSKRQEIVSLSTTESEYVAATHAAKEALWLRQLISQLFEPIAGPTTIFSDNQSAIALTKDH